jgi:hypothetical protein
MIVIQFSFAKAKIRRVDGEDVNILRAFESCKIAQARRGESSDIGAKYMNLFFQLISRNILTRDLAEFALQLNAEGPLETATLPD